MLKRFRQAKADVLTMRRLFPEAERLARADGRAQPACDDLVVAALALPDGTARAALDDVGVDPDALRSAIAGARGESDAQPLVDEPRGPLRSDPSMQLTFHRAVALAKAAKRPVASADVLRAALDADDPTVARAFVALGVTRDHLLDALGRATDPR